MEGKIVSGDRRTKGYRPCEGVILIFFALIHELIHFTEENAVLRRKSGELGSIGFP